MEQNNKTTAKADKKNSQRAKSDRQEALASFQRLRRDGVLTRQQFRRIMFDKGLQSGVKGSPMITTYEIEKQGKKKVLVTKTQQWTRI